MLKKKASISTSPNKLVSQKTFPAGSVFFVWLFQEPCYGRDMQEIPFPVRINRYLALKGLVTRRAADQLIRDGLVRLNGKRAELGSRVESALDTVEILPSDRPEKEHAYIAYYKPAGVITHSPQQGERSIADVSGFTDLFPVGRLDKASEGLIILTNDGRVTERLLHPRFVHEKEYVVTAREKILPDVKWILEKGVRNSGEKLVAQRVTITGPHTLTIVLTEGKKHQIRRMLSEVSLTVERLVRTRIMDVHLEALKPGASRTLSGKSRQGFLESIGLEKNLFAEK